MVPKSDFLAKAIRAARPELASRLAAAIGEAMRADVPPAPFERDPFLEPFMHAIQAEAKVRCDAFLDSIPRTIVVKVGG